MFKGREGQMPITLSVKSASAASSLSPRTLWYAIERGDLGTVRIGRRRLIPARALEKFLLGRKPRTAKAATKPGKAGRRGGDRLSRIDSLEQPEQTFR
jgi:excisionase family DNA binding protein